MKFKVWTGIALWILSTIFWAASGYLGAWLIRTAWEGVIALLLAGTLVAMAGVRGAMRGPLLHAIGASLLVSAGGPLTVLFLQAVGTSLARG